MGVIKWFGYITAAIITLSVVIGAGAALALVIGAFALVFCIFMAVTLVAHLIKAWFES